MFFACFKFTGWLFNNVGATLQKDLPHNFAFIASTDGSQTLRRNADVRDIWLDVAEGWFLSDTQGYAM